MQIVTFINEIFWNYFLIFLLVFCGIYYTFKLKFVQLTNFKDGLRVFTKKTEDKNSISPLSALMTSISAQVGTGNIAGVSLAIICGGPGAIFWMWISAFFGMATIFAEATLAQKYKKVEKNDVVGGPSFYIEKALGKKVAIFFSVIAILALGFIGPIVQSNSVADAFKTAFNINPKSTGIFLTILCLLVFLGGVKRLTKVSEKVVPFMAISYIIGSIIVIFVNRANIVTALESIINNAFKTESFRGFGVGITVRNAIRYGISRGLFSNEAGMGSTPHAHALAKVKHPCNQGIVAVIGVFIDTFIILNITALVILTSFDDFSELLQSGYIGVSLAQHSFSSVLGGFGIYFIAICMFFFGFSSILGLYLFGQMNVKYIFKGRFTKLYALLVLFCVVIGSSLEIKFVWEVADTLNGLLVVPNVISLLILSDEVLKLYREYKNSR